MSVQSTSEAELVAAFGIGEKILFEQPALVGAEFCVDVFVDEFVFHDLYFLVEVIVGQDPALDLFEVRSGELPQQVLLDIPLNFGTWSHIKRSALGARPTLNVSSPPRISRRQVP